MRIRAQEPVEPRAAGTAPSVGPAAGLPEGVGLPSTCVFSPGLVVGVPGDPDVADVAHGHDESEPDEGGLGSLWWLTVLARDRNQGLARFLGGIHMLAHDRGAAVDEFAPDRVGAPMGWSTSMAARWIQFADEVIDRLPMLHTALGEGWLDETKARACCDWTRGMPLDLARMVVAALLGVAPEVTTSDLIERIGSHAAALDPDWARRRELAARARARVVAVQTPAGTADVCARDLPLDQAAPMVARLDDLARAVRAGGLAGGVSVGIGLVRALCSLRLQDGTYTGYDDDTLLDALIGELPTWQAATRGDDPGPTDDPGDGPGPGSDDTGPDDTRPDDTRPDDTTPDDTGPDDTGPDDGPGSMSDDAPGTSPADTGPADNGAPDNGSDEDGADEDGAGERFERTSGGVRTGTVELRLRLSTALGLDDLPGRVPAWGSVTAATGRSMLDHARVGDVPTECRVVLTDDDGDLQYVFLARLDPPGPPSPRRRPPRPRRHQDRRRGNVRGRRIVELAAATTMLAALHPDDHPAWAGLIRHAQQRLAGLSDAERIGGAAHPATNLAESHRRRPGRELDRWIRVRDRHCRGPRCTRPAHRVDLDHTRAWIDDGLTTAGNLGGCCRHCHRLKHTGDWRLDQPQPGRFVWTTPAGATYAVPRRPVLEPLPAPAPRADGHPRPVVDIEPPWGDHPAWIVEQPRAQSTADVPASPAAPPTRRDDPDGPPF